MEPINAALLDTPIRAFQAPPHLTNSPPGMVPVSNPPSLHSICHTDTPSARDPRTSRTLPILYPHIKAVLDRLCPLISPAVCSHLLATPWTLPAPHTSASPSLFLTGIFADQGIMGCRTEDSFSARQRRWSQLLQRSQGRLIQLCHSPWDTHLTSPQGLFFHCMDVIISCTPQCVLTVKWVSICERLIADSQQRVCSIAWLCVRRRIAL